MAAAVRSAPSAQDTIVASATPWGRGAIGVVRLSGPGVAEVLGRVCPRPRGLPRARRAVLVKLRDVDASSSVFDEGLLTWMPGPGSYTGEDSAEISCHGNPLLVERLLAACVDAGCRMAGPGEFTRRAWQNGRLDLLRAEAVLQAIEARSPEGLDVATRALRGELSSWLEGQRLDLVGFAAELEALLDFPDQLDPLDERRLLGALEAAETELGRVAATFRKARVQVQGAQVALVGPVNAGKSSLFNVLLGRRRALVSARPGTTRDVLEASCEIGGLPVVLMDSAGENRRPETLEAAGLALRDELLVHVDLLVVVLPAHLPQLAEGLDLLAATAGRPRVLVGNHADRPGAALEIGGQRLLHTCALDGTGLDALRAAIASALVGDAPGNAAVVIASQRQHDLLLRAAEHVAAARRAQLGDAGPAVAAEEVLVALEQLDELGGRGLREEVLDTLFARFCIGK